MKYTVDQIRDAARGACFYVTPGGMWLRMQYTDVDGFCASDEDSGEDYMFSFDELVEDGEDPEFHHLTRTRLGTPTLADTNEWIEP